MNLDGYQFYVDHWKRSVWIPVFKGGSESMRDAIGDFMRGESRVPRCKMHYYMDGYTWILTGVRDPRERLRSYWTGKVPVKIHATFGECVEAMRAGWRDPHIVPITSLYAGLKHPEIVVRLEDLGARSEEIRSYFRWPLPIEHLNASPASMAWQTLFDQELTHEQRVWLEQFYREDIESFGYAPYHA